MQTLDTVVKIAGVVGMILGVILGAKMFGPERRKTDAEARSVDASTIKIMSEQSVATSEWWRSEARQWKAELDELREYVDELETSLETSIEAWTEWARQAALLLEQAGLELPPRPPRPKRPRPPRHKPEG